jgi:hypothetical protein
MYARPSIVSKLHAPSSPLLLRRAGDAAEALVCELLQRKFGDGFDVATQWVSSARTRVLPSTAGLGRADDAAGYDFVVEDKQQWLVLAQGAAFVRCYIEVKVGWPGALQLLGCSTSCRM